MSEAAEAAATAVPDMNPATTTIQAGVPTAGTQDIQTGIQTGKKSHAFACEKSPESTMPATDLL